MTELTSHDTAARGSFPNVSPLWVGIAVVAASVLIPGFSGNQYWSYSFTLVALYTAVAVFQNILMSEAGQFSLGQGVIFGVGAVTAASLTTLFGYPYWLSAIGGFVAGLLMGALYAGPALRVQGYYLGFVTLSAALVFPQLVIAFDSVTGGVNGVPVYVGALVTPIVGTLTPLSLLAIALAVGALSLHYVFPKTRLGRKMIVSSVSTESAQSLGTNPGVIRFIAFLIAAAGTALAGILYVPLIGFVGPTNFRVDFSVLFFLAVIVGGQGKLLAPILGIWIVYLVPNVLLADFSHLRLMIYGLVALFVMLVFPDGLVGSIEKWWTARRPADTRTSFSLQDVFDALPETAGEGAASQDDRPLVSVRGATKYFGNAVALDGAGLDIRQGTIHGLVGPNGSGKTTMLNAVSGFLKLDSGAVRLFDHDVVAMPAWKRARLGLARTFQTPRIFEALSIRDNIRIGAEGHGGAQNSGFMEALATRDLPWLDRNPSLLPHGQRRLLEILRVLESDAPVILLDEPAGGLSAEERKDLARLLVHFRDKIGKTILLVEHDLSMVWQVADDITVMELGTVAAQGAPDEIRNDANVKKLFTGV
ncbi:MAG: ATP-binding cassette domain-containing protein [Pseudomonadota bacterium]|nr:ATP-binding cassette domain-containing protein [Pseudomonadota bacterium]